MKLVMVEVFTTTKINECILMLFVGIKVQTFGKNVTGMFISPEHCM
jgi:hypothetical protein